MTRAPEDVACQELVELITAYLEDALPSEQAAEISGHLKICPGCGAYLDQFRATIAALGTVSVETLSAPARADLLAAFRDLSTGSGRH